MSTSLPTRPPPPQALRTCYRALLWDNDGVLVDTERWYFEATREVLEAAGVRLTEADYLEYFLKRSLGVTEILAGAAESKIAAVRAARDRRYEQHLAEQPLLLAGARETLAALRPHFTMGIVTTSRREHFAAIHARTGLLPYFDFVLTIEDCSHSKPHPDPYLRGIARTGVAPAECLAIEDSPRGLAAARAAGLDCWVIPTDLSRGAEFSTATRVLHQISDVADLLGCSSPLPTASQSTTGLRA